MLNISPGQGRGGGEREGTPVGYAQVGSEVSVQLSGAVGRMRVLIGPGSNEKKGEELTSAAASSGLGRHLDSDG